MALGLTVWRMVLVQEAQTKGVREVDMAAVVDNECVAVWLFRPLSPWAGRPRSRRFSFPFAEGGGFAWRASSSAGRE